MRIKKALFKTLYLTKLWSAISPKGVENRFTNIYNKKVWFGNKESLSGSGSSLKTTDRLRTDLPKVLTKLKTSRLIDVGCGDFNWMRLVDLPCNYIGLDIVEPLILENNRKYKSDGVTFMHCNAIEDILPVGDTILCRDVVFHLSFNDGIKLLQNVQKSGAKYLITTSHSEVDVNKDIRTGNFRRINLELAPYSLPKPIERLEDNPLEKDRFLGVWEVQSLP